MADDINTSVSDDDTSSEEAPIELKLKKGTRRRSIRRPSEPVGSDAQASGPENTSAAKADEEIEVTESTENIIDEEDVATAEPDMAGMADDAPVTVSPEAISGTIRSHVIAAMGMGLVPVPVLDIVGVVGIQLKLVHSLSKKYEVKYTENIAKTLILSLIGGVLPTAVGGSLASLVKMVPGLGTFAGAAGVSVLAGGLTYAVGRVFASHFASGGTLMDFNPSSVRGKFKEQFKRGKNVAAKMEEDDEAVEVAGKA